MNGDRPEQDVLLLTSEVAVMVRLPEGTLRRYRYEGKGPAWFRSGRRAVYWRSAVLAWLRQQEQESQEKQASEHRRSA